MVGRSWDACLSVRMSVSLLVSTPVCPNVCLSLRSFVFFYTSVCLRTSICFTFLTDSMNNFREVFFFLRNGFKNLILNFEKKEEGGDQGEGRH
jgi:hypothetical protein